MPTRTNAHNNRAGLTALSYTCYPKIRVPVRFSPHNSRTHFTHTYIHCNLLILPLDLNLLSLPSDRRRGYGRVLNISMLHTPKYRYNPGPTRTWAQGQKGARARTPVRSAILSLELKPRTISLYGVPLNYCDDRL